MEESSPSFVKICGVLAPFTSIAVCLAPIPTINKIVRDRSVGSLPLLPYSSMFVNGFVWVVYGMLIHAPNVWLSNAVGMTLGLYYSRVFKLYCPQNARDLPGTISQHMQAASIMIVFTSLISMILPTKKASPIIGLEGVIICIILFASPLSALRKVVETKSSKSIPLPFTMAVLVNCICWIVYGTMDLKDPNIYAPNSLGLLFSLAQLLLKMIYRNDAGVDEQKEMELLVT